MQAVADARERGARCHEPGQQERGQRGPSIQDGLGSRASRSCKPPSGPDTSRLFNLAFLRLLEIWTLDYSPVDVGEFGVFRCELASWLCFVFRALIFGRCRRMYLRVK